MPQDTHLTSGKCDNLIQAVWFEARTLSHSIYPHYPIPPLPRPHHHHHRRPDGGHEPQEPSDGGKESQLCQLSQMQWLQSAQGKSWRPRRPRECENCQGRGSLGPPPHSLCLAEEASVMVLSPCLHPVHDSHSHKFPTSAWGTPTYAQCLNRS